MSQYQDQLREMINRSDKTSFLEDIKVDVTDTSYKGKEKDHGHTLPLRSLTCGKRYKSYS